MAFKSLLNVHTDPAFLNQTLNVAEHLAGVCDAHLEVLCLGVDHTRTGFYDAGATADLLQAGLARAKDEAETLDQLARAQLDQANARWSVDTGVAQIFELGRAVASRARFNDLVILPKPYGPGRDTMDLEISLEGALFDGQVPVLVIPETPVTQVAPKRVVLAWNESAEALNAARAAIPLLAAADLVHIVVIDPPQHGPTRSDPGGPLSAYLARHGVRAEVDVLTKSMPRVSDILARHVSEVGADLIVMGAYGHSRFREAILGGATRNMLQIAPVPVFMAH